jgi:hypothetical protein
MAGRSSLFLPELVEPKPGRWTKFECDIADAAVDTGRRVARVPKPYTEATRLARLHEMTHAKHSPREISPVVKRVMRIGMDNGQMLREDVAQRMTRMLEENRIDWIAWKRYHVDIRSCREVLDWTKMKPPEDPYRALGQVLQLAWTVWGSKGLGTIAGAPPPREPAPDVVEYFDACWDVVEAHNEAILPAMIRACLRMYEQPTHDMRDHVAAELAAFFPPEQKEDKPEPPPPMKEEEAEAQKEAEEKEAEQEKRQEEDESGAGAEAVEQGHYEVHDHTASIKRPSMRIARRERPVFAGTKFTFAHRYMLDRAIFAQRMLTEGGIMIDGSGSMHWTDEDMEMVLSKMPAVTIGRYSGFYKYGTASPIRGRICILAKKGRFSAHVEAQEEGASMGNDVDFEALEMLATWPKPRFWLSDGLVCGGKHDGYSTNPQLVGIDGWIRSHGKLVEKCNAFMKQHEILRVPNRQVMVRLLQRQRVTVYGSCITRNPADLDLDFWKNSSESSVDAYWPAPLKDWPVSFCL